MLNSEPLRGATTLTGIYGFSFVKAPLLLDRNLMLGEKKLDTFLLKAENSFGKKIHENSNQKRKNIMGFCSLHFEKHGNPSEGQGAADATRLGNHIDRIAGKEYSFRHADLSRTKDNISVPSVYNKYVSMPYKEAIIERVKDGYKGERALRKDAVWSVNTVLSGSHEELTEIAKDPQRLQEWVLANLRWCEKNFGKENIVRFKVHLDETTPHIHCVWCPITDDGKLSAQKWIGKGDKLEDLQTSYAEEMKKFGLKRGVKSDKKHIPTDAWRREQERKKKSIQELTEELTAKINSLSAEDLTEEKKKELNEDITSITLIIREKEAETANILKKAITITREQNRELIATIDNRKPIESKYIPKEDVEAIIDNSNVVDYFLHLSQRGVVNFQKKKGKEYIFTDNSNSIKLYASEKGWKEFKSGEGGQIVAAVKKFENMNWLEAVNFLKDFQGYKGQYEEMRAKIKEETPELGADERKVTFVTRPNNPELIKYFRSRGISYDTLAEYTQQVHFQHGDKHLFGIGNMNVSGGYDIRLPFEKNGKSKVGRSNFSTHGNLNKANKMIIVEGMTNMLSMVEILKAQKKKLDEYYFVCLNSTSNVKNFLENIYDYRKRWEKVSLILDGDPAGDAATKEILNDISYWNAKDHREYFGIGQGNNDLNDYLLNGIQQAQQQEQQQEQEQEPEEEEQTRSRGRRM